MTVSSPYIMLLGSLPPLGDLFGQQQTPLTEIQLRHRLKYLTGQDSKTLPEIDQVVRRSKQTAEWTDGQIVKSTKALLPHLKSGTLRQAVEFVINLRTIVAALRRRRLGENSPPAKSDWGYSPWIKRIERHWTEPDFGLGSAVHWLPEATRLWDDDDSVELERLILVESWKQLSCLSHGHYFDFTAVGLYLLSLRLLI